MHICPEIPRLHLVVERLSGIDAVEEQPACPLPTGLTQRSHMTSMADTPVFSPDAVSRLNHGLGGFHAWAESGCAFYTWHEGRLFTLDISSRKGSEPLHCIDSVRDALQPARLEWRLV